MSGAWEELAHEFVFLPHIACNWGASILLGASKARFLENFEVTDQLEALAVG